MSDPSVLVIPLGGLGEFGMNMMAFRTGDDIIVVDAGLMFPESELLGVDVVLPDIAYLKQHREHVRGILLTHGHEDHLGALPYLIGDLDVPIYGSRFTLALLRKKLQESGHLETAVLRDMQPGV
ncbi:MAG TPA: MBL fold metallo-hydrolase, partial [Candidatus Acidoferrum sp.]|nr:MBL fold metallo-hydrolase [Candidatus Acidoferrum sp.]